MKEEECKKCKNHCERMIDIYSCDMEYFCKLFNCPSVCVKFCNLMEDK